MTGDIPKKEEKTQPPLASAKQPKPARISPRKTIQSLSMLRIAPARIKPLESESGGKGGNADVIPAVLTAVDASEPSRPADVQHVAIKKLRLDDDTDDTRVLVLLAHEVHLLNNLAHDNIVKIIGFVEDTKNGIAWIILPWEKNGNLREFIGSADWAFPERIALIHDVAKGIEYLHGREPPICHGDLKSLNVLVNSENQAVITDFGSARTVESTSQDVSRSRAPNLDIVPHLNTNPPRVEVSASGTSITLTGSKWTLRWAAPELLAGSPPDLASDIWAFGWICWEVMTSNFPFEGESDISVVVQIVEGRLPPVHGDGRLDQVLALANLMIDCWNLDPGKRPMAKSCERQVYWMDRTTPCGRNGSESSEIRSARLLTSLAVMHVRHGRLDEVMELLLRAMNIARSTKDQEATADAVHVLGEVYRMRGDYSGAEESYIVARDIYSRIGSQGGFADAVYGLGEIYRLQDKYTQAEESYITARDIYARIKDQCRLADSVKALGDVYYSRGDDPKAEESYITSRDIYAQIGSQLGFANVVTALGDVYSLRGKYTEAEDSYIAARDIYARIGDQIGHANAVYGLGEVYYLRKDYSKAEESYLAARDIYGRIGDKPGHANVARSLGDVYRSREEYSKAEESYTTARDIYARVGDKVGHSTTVHGLGDVYYSRREYSKAEESYLAAREIYTRIGSQVDLANVATALGDVHRAREEYFEAEGRYITARDIYVRIGDQAGHANAIYRLGQIYDSRREYSRAEEFYLAARDIYHQIESLGKFADALSELGKFYLLQEKYDKSEESYVSARGIYFRIGDQSGFANTFYGLGEVYRVKHEYLKAQKYYVTARDIYTQVGDKSGVTNTSTALSQVSDKRKKYTKVEQFYMKLGWSKKSEPRDTVHYIEKPPLRRTPSGRRGPT